MPDYDDKFATIVEYLLQTFLDAKLSHGWADAHTYEFRMVHGGLVHKVLFPREFLDGRTPAGLTVFVHLQRLGQAMVRAGGRSVLVGEEGITVQEEPQEPASP
jgi:hypothetical protein